MKIIVVDDSRLSRMMLRSFISERFPSWELVEAASGEEALAVIDSGFAAALLDLNMPGMNGLELALILKERFPGLALAMVTANIQDKMRQRAVDLGMGFISKPVVESELAALLQRMTGAE